MNCREFTSVSACFENTGTGDLTPIVIHYEYALDPSGNAIIVATRYTDAQGVIFPIINGNVLPGPCSYSLPDVEWALLCDVQPDGTVVEFFRRALTTFGINNVINATQVEDFLLNKTTPYIPSGTVESCQGECDDATALGVLNYWGEDQGSPGGA